VNNRSQSQKLGIYLGGLGAAIGSIAWLVVLGFAIQSLWLIIVPLVYGLIGWLLWSALALKFPNRILGIIGLFALWFVIFNFIVGNLIYDQIPAEIWGEPTNVEQQTVSDLNRWLTIFGIVGLALIIWDRIKSKRIS
jgi:hypothetical protein